jgi:ADP-ribose pyrophosphatase
MYYKLLEKKPLYRGFFKLDAYSVDHECYEGGNQTIVREHLERGDAAAVLLYDQTLDEVLLIEQFRIGPAVRDDEAWLVEIVAWIIRVYRALSGTC